MNSLKQKLILILFLGLLYSHNILAQKDQINWISFEQLDDSLALKPKKVFISFFADWCSYCKKMNKVAYKNPKVISILNSDYYAVKMNVETRDTISFEGKNFVNAEYGKKRRPTHQIPLLIASRKGRPFSLPATIILDANFRIRNRQFEYLSTKKMLEMLRAKLN